MNTKYFSFLRNAANWAVGLGLVVVMLFSAVTPAFAATINISSIVVSAQSGSATYGAGANVSFTVTFTSAGSGTLSNVIPSVAGLPAGVSASFKPNKLSFSGAISRPTTLTLVTSSTSPAGVKSFNVGYKVKGKAGSANGTGSLTIDKRALTIGGSLVADKVYDGTTTAAFNPPCGVGPACYSLSGMVNGDAISLNTTAASANFANKNTGSQSVTVTGLAPAGLHAADYSIGTVTPTASITPASLAVLPYSVAMGTTDMDPVSGFGFGYGPFKGSDTAATAITTAPSCAIYDQGTNKLAQAAPRPAGAYDIDCSGGVAANGNYLFDFSSKGTLSVSAAGAPHVGGLPTPVDFHSQLIGTSSLVQALTLTNNATGPVALNITSISISGAPFSLVTAGSTCYNGSAWAASLAMGASCTVNVQFAPAAVVVPAGSIHVVSNDAAAPNFAVALTGSGSNGTQILLNRSYELDLDHNLIPDRWAKGGTWVAGDGQDCTIHFNGLCSVKLVGSGKPVTITQTLKKSGVAGRGIVFALYSKALNVPTNAPAYNVRVLLYNGTKLVGSSPVVSFTKGTHGFKLVKGAFTAPADFTRIVFKITFRAASGSVWFDQAILKW